MFSQGRSLAADNESTSQQTTKQPPAAACSACKSCFDKLCVGRPERCVARSSFSGALLAHGFPRGTYPRICSTRENVHHADGLILNLTALSSSVPPEQLHMLR